MELRNYQEQAITGLSTSLAEGNKQVILQAATGSGKTVMAASLVRRAVDKGSSVLFLAHRRELISQCSNKLSLFGIGHGIIMAGEVNEGWHLVQIASVDTLRARALSTNRMRLPKADIVIIDECHRSLSKTYRSIISIYEKSFILGLTATPCRGDGLGLGHVYSDMVCAPSIKTLTTEGHLVPAKYFAPSIPDLTGVKLIAGDYNKKQLATRMDTPKLVGDVVSNWINIANGKTTVVFASSVQHSINLMESFQELGIKAGHIDGSTETEERDLTLKQLEDGEITVLCNCLVLTEGWDCPSAEVCVLARPTKSLGLYLQMVGRVLRPMEGKDKATIIDHSGAVYDHGFVDDEFEWDLDPKKKIQELKKRELKRETKPITCEKCFTIYEKIRACPSCGTVHIRKGRSLITGEGELGEVSRTTRKAKKKEYSTDQKKSWYAMLRGYASTKGYKDGWAYYKYHDKFGVAPPWKKTGTVDPSLEVLSWITYINIRNSKRKIA